MDSISHIVLGAAIGDKLLGKKIGRKAAWIGALAKTFPDFDLFISGLSDPRKYILYHRSYTHSFFIELLTAFPMAFLCYILFKKKVSYGQWFLLWISCLWLHSVVDWCTNYGIRLFLPFSSNIYSSNSIAILDLFLTTPILIMVIAALFFKNNSRGRSGLMTSILVYSTLYFCMTFVNKSMADKHLQKSLTTNNIQPKQYMSNPTILNNLLWYAVVNTDSNLLIGEYSLLQKTDSIRWYKFPIQGHLLKSNPSPDARMLEWFSQGYYICKQDQDTLNVFTVKFGRGDLDQSIPEKTFLFYYQIYYENGQWKFKSHEPSREEMKFKEGFEQLVNRIKAKHL